MTHKELALHLLREAGDRGVTTAEMLQAGVGSRYSARLLELRQEGHLIESERIREGSWLYTLTHDAERGGGGANPQRPGIPAATASPGAEGGAGESNRGSLSAGAADTGALFDLPAPPREAALHDYEEEAA